MNCAYCGVEFDRPHTRGPAPKFCKASHRQRAYELRRVLRLIDQWSAKAA